jgi:hypothetical protein
MSGGAIVGLVLLALFAGRMYRIFTEGGAWGKFCIGLMIAAGVVGFGGDYPLIGFGGILFCLVLGTFTAYMPPGTNQIIPTSVTRPYPK